MPECPTIKEMDSKWLVKRVNGETACKLYGDQVTKEGNIAMLSSFNNSNKGVRVKIPPEAFPSQSWNVEMIKSHGFK